MKVNPERYFIALIPPPPLFEAAKAYKHDFEARYQSKASLNSPPHITLHMPFEWRADKENELVQSLHTLAGNLAPVTVTLKDFGNFSPRVIFIRVIPSEPLEQLQYKVRQFCKKELGLFNADYKDLPFHPHLTVAFRDLKKPVFEKAWAEFKNKSFEAEFIADRICLLKHDGVRWNLFREFVLTG